MMIVHDHVRQAALPLFRGGEGLSCRGTTTHLGHILSSVSLSAPPESSALT